MLVQLCSLSDCQAHWVNIECRLKAWKHVGSSWEFDLCLIPCLICDSFSVQTQKRRSTALQVSLMTACVLLCTPVHSRDMQPSDSKPVFCTAAGGLPSSFCCSLSQFYSVNGAWTMKLLTMSNSSATLLPCDVPQVRNQTFKPVASSFRKL